MLVLALGDMDSDIADPALWRLISTDDLDAFRVLYQRHAMDVEAFCLRRTADQTLAEEATSEVFLELWRDRRRLKVTGDSVRPLLLGIALNVLRHRWRTERRHRATLRRIGEALDPSPSTDSPAPPSEALARARDLVEQLPRSEAETLILIAWGELSYEETAATLGVPVGTVRSRLARARRRLTGLKPEPLLVTEES